MEELEFDFESDETFAFIAGYTDGGAAYGVTYEEMAEIEKLEKLDFGFQFFHLEFDNDDWEASFIDDEELEDEWFDPGDKELALQLLVEQRTPTNWASNDWYDSSFNWDNYFGLKGKEKTREELIHHLNLNDLLREMRRKKRNESNR